jgi:2-phospho-L-lactate guanylyltransferase
VPIVAVLPVKSFALGKGRMAGDLTEAFRIRLGKVMAENTAAKAAEAGMIPLLVAGDSDVAEWAIGAGLASIPDPGTGLDDAARTGVTWARQARCDWVVLHTDLPLVTEGELRLLANAIEEGAGVIAPSADGGTSALAAQDEVDFRYGPGSFHRHLALLPGSLIVATTGLLHDVDSVRDMESAQGHARGRWLEGALS